MERLLTIFSPQSAVISFLYRAPLLLWRMGLGWLLPRSMLVLTTRGRVSGLPRHTMLEHVAHDGRVIIGSAWGDRSQWARNLAADPVISAETWSGGVTRGRVRAISDESTLRTLQARLMRSRDPVANQISDATFLFWQIEPADVTAPVPLARDLRCFPPLLPVLLVVLLLARQGGSL